MDSVQERYRFGLLEYLLVFVLLAVLILTALWPWPLYFRTGFPDHFDPPFHAWKLQVGADKILRQHRLVPDTQTNVYYPYANEFYFDALLWPQAVLAALFRLAGCGPVLTYNLVFLLFWALSGLCMYLLLRELNLRRLSSLFGAAAMCLIPYRVSYYVEFNMQMCFGLPLFLLFWVRFARRPGIGNAVGLGLAFWLQAVSELYQAVILALSFPLIVLPWLGEIVRRHGRSLRLYLSVAAGLLTVVPLCLLYLWPYFSLFHGGYGRSASEMTAHSLEPLAYLGRQLLSLVLPAGAPGRVKLDEMDVFPSLTLLLLVAGYGISARHLLRSAQPGGETGPVRMLRWFRVIPLAGFAVLILGLARSSGTGSGRLLLLAGNSALATALAATLLLAAFKPPQRQASRLCHGLAAAALLCFILSLGPSLLVLSRHVMADNLVFSLVGSFFPLSGFRVMSRFSIIVMIFLIVAGSCFLDRAAGRRRHLQWLALPLLATLLLEAHAIPHAYRRFSVPIAPSTLEAIRSRADATLTVIPLGNRRLDGRYMLAIAGSRTLMVNGFGGFSPALQRKIGFALRTRPRRAFSLISSIWPPSLLLVDRQALARFNNQGYATTEALVRARGELVASDRNFALYAPVEPQGPVTEYRRFVRGDILRADPVFSFEARSAARDAQDLFVLLNGTVVAAVRAGNQWQRYRVPLPAAGITGIDYEMVFVRGLDGQSPWMARNGTFGPAVPDDGASPDYADLAARVWRQGAPAWMRYVTRLPVQAIPLNITFANGVRLAGISLPGRPVSPGETVALRTFWIIPPSLGRVALIADVIFAGPDGSEIAASRALVHHMPLTFVLSQPVTKIFVEQLRLVVPPAASPGAYRFRIRLRDAATGRPVAVRGSAVLPADGLFLHVESRVSPAVGTVVPAQQPRAPGQYPSLITESDQQP